MSFFADRYNVMLYQSMVDDARRDRIRQADDARQRLQDSIEYFNRHAAVLDENRIKLATVLWRHKECNRRIAKNEAAVERLTAELEQLRSTTRMEQWKCQQAQGRIAGRTETLAKSAATLHGWKAARAQAGPAADAAVAAMFPELGPDAAAAFLRLHYDRAMAQMQVDGTLPPDIGQPPRTSESAS